MAFARGKKGEPVVLGKRYKDCISGFTGIAVAKTEWLYGCIRITLAGTVTDGEPKDFTFDEPQLVTVEDDKLAVPVQRGGGRPTPSRTGH